MWKKRFRGLKKRRVKNTLFKGEDKRSPSKNEHKQNVLLEQTGSNNTKETGAFFAGSVKQITHVTANVEAGHDMP